MDSYEVGSCDVESCDVGSCVADSCDVDSCEVDSFDVDSCDEGAEARSMTTETEHAPSELSVSLSALVELAVDWWRFERWVAASVEARELAHARHLARRLDKFLRERELSVLDLTGAKYEAGLAVEVLDVVTDESLAEGTEMVEETIAPIVMWRGRVVKHGQVIIKRRS